MIKERIEKILSQLPIGVEVVAAGKMRSVSQLQQAVESGIKIIGENYVQEAEKKIRLFRQHVQWHLIGHLQKNKVKRAVEIFDMIESLDSLDIACEINKACQLNNKVMPILIEVNCAREEQKTGLFPEDVEPLINEIRKFKFIRILGLMTMGPFLDDPQQLRSYFKETHQLFEHIKSLNLSQVKMQYLSMGMSDSYLVAIEEGANLVRIGTAIFNQGQY